MKIAALPFHERPLLELLNLHIDRDAPAHDYAGYGWARAEHLWLATHEPAAPPVRVDDALVLALHTADDAEALDGDIDLEFELELGPPAAVRASLFLAQWLPRLPRDPQAIVLALCNPHDATLRLPSEAPAPLHYAAGDVFSWIDRETREVHLVGDRWSRLNP
ncbi:MAG: hypothetical protein SFX73_40220 [Kofleriaceae bacterium]|nr:hypothetical protein [Kofleriaceae bacterium]